MRNGVVRIGVIAVVMVAAVAGRGCVTAPPPAAASLVSGAKEPVHTSGLIAGDGASPGPAAPAASASAPSATQTADERRAALDERLNDSLDAFDGHLREEQQKTAQERDARQATVSATAAAAAADASGASSASAGSNAPADASAAGGTSGSSASPPAGASHGGAQRARRESSNAHAGDLKSDKSAGSDGNVGGNGAAATVVPDGNDDDIVARRIRKAAELETDPELKDKLWREYVAYKKNSQVR
jgi:hypothetical protein